MAKKLEVTQLHLEGDSLIIINAIIQGEAPSWELNKYIQIIKKKLNSFLDFKVSHVKRECNSVANTLSKMVVSINDGQDCEIYEDFWNVCLRL